ncbi:aldehyde dehydrogenase family protein [Specibacter cremeus]|uniref:aldehyde dehydrogenase family protein n=1 Tax=Specibacter cremeus TaxID=1629051 RepID=UPI0030B80851
MRAYYEEFFGPVVVVSRAPCDAEALELASDTPYGQGGVKRSGFGPEPGPLSMDELGMDEFVNKRLLHVGG